MEVFTMKKVVALLLVVSLLGTIALAAAEPTRIITNSDAAVAFLDFDGPGDGVIDPEDPDLPPDVDLPDEIENYWNLSGLGFDFGEHVISIEDEIYEAREEDGAGMIVFARLYSDWEIQVNISEFSHDYAPTAALEPTPLRGFEIDLIDTGADYAYLNSGTMTVAPEVTIAGAPDAGAQTIAWATGGNARGWFGAQFDGDLHVEAFSIERPGELTAQMTWTFVGQN